jgi:hypothetical protein
VFSPSHLFRMLTEMVFMFAGALLLFVGLTGRYLFDARRPSWLVLAVVLFLWGVRSWRQARLIAVRKPRIAGQIGGASLILVGMIMLSLAWVKLGMVGPLVAIAGIVFVVRGLTTAALLAMAA